MSETVLQQKQQLVDDALRMIDEEMAYFAGLSPSEKAVESEIWFRKEIVKALAPLIARIEKLETRPSPAPTPTTGKPPKEFISAIGHELKERDQHIEALERRITNSK